MWKHVYTKVGLTLVFVHNRFLLLLRVDATQYTLIKKHKISPGQINPITAYAVIGFSYFLHQFALLLNQF